MYLSIHNTAEKSMLVDIYAALFNRDVVQFLDLVQTSTFKNLYPSCYIIIILQGTSVVTNKIEESQTVLHGSMCLPVYILLVYVCV